jgi:hypothetical protein
MERTIGADSASGRFSVAVALRPAPRTAESPLGVGRKGPAESFAEAPPIRIGTLHKLENAISQTRRATVMLRYPYDDVDGLFHGRSVGFRKLVNLAEGQT